MQYQNPGCRIEGAGMINSCWHVACLVTNKRWRMCMERSNWKGSISFGLVSIPIILHNSEDTSEKVFFHQIDKRNNSRIKYQRINAETGKQVSWENIGKAYQYNKEIILPIEEGELEKVVGENIRTIAIENFINSEDINFIDIEKTYYLLPDKKGEKGYVILREALKRTEKIGIAKVIISTKEHLSAVAYYKNTLVLYLLRYSNQIKPLQEFKLPSENLKANKVTAKEVEIANQLIKSMSSKWKPNSYKDEYQEVVHKWAKSKIKNKAIPKMHQRSLALKSEGKVVDFVDLLRKSLGKKAKSEKSKRAKKHASK